MNKTLEKIAMVLLLIGGLTWGLTLFGINLVEVITGAIGLVVLAKIIYGAVGVSALVVAYKEYA